MRKVVESTFMTLDGEIQAPHKWGPKDRTLMAHGLVDGFHFWVFPILAGSGHGLVDDIELTHLDLVDTTKFGSGIVVLTYAPES